MVVYSYNNNNWLQVSNEKRTNFDCSHFSGRVNNTKNYEQKRRGENFVFEARKFSKIKFYFLISRNARSNLILYSAMEEREKNDKLYLNIEMDIFFIR